MKKRCATEARIWIALCLMTIVMFVCPSGSLGQAGARHTLSLESQMNSDDIYVGTSYRVGVLLEHGLGIGLSFNIRPYREWVREPIGPRVFMQMRETRYCFGIAGDKVFSLRGPVGVFAGLGAAYTAADLEGTHRAPHEGWTPMADLGLRLTVAGDDLYRVEVRAGYRYMALWSDSDHWLHLVTAVGF